MNSKKFYFERNTEYYIWWLLNSYSPENVATETQQIKKDVSSLINKIERFCKKSGTHSTLLGTLTELCLFDYNVQDYKEYREDYAQAEAQSEKEFQEKWQEAYREASRKAFRQICK